MKITCDQIKISDHFLSGEACLGKQRVLISLKTNSELERLIKSGKSLYLANLKADISQVEPATNPGEFDFAQYYKSKKINYRLKISNYRIVLKKQTFFDKLHYFRFKIQNYLRSLPKLVSFFASEMILAENPSKDNKDILNNYRDLGVIHLLSISGLHVALYTSAIAILATVFKRVQSEIIVSCIIFLILEVFFSNFQPGFVRASLSYIYGVLFNQKKIPITSIDKLGVVVLTHLFINPGLFLSTGAILSYLLVLGLELTQNTSQLKQGSLLNLLILPIVLHYFYQVNFLTTVFNLLIVPIFNFVLLPLTFLAVVIFPILPRLVDIIERIFKNIIMFIDYLAKTNLGKVTFGQINWWQTIIILVITLSFLIYFESKKINRKLLSILVGAYGIYFTLIHFPLYGQVSFIDVGQGDSILITTPLKRKVYLIDTGGKLRFGNFAKNDPQLNRITIPLLHAQGIDKIDGVFLSHQDADHIGDLAPLLKQVKVKKLYFAKGLTNNLSFQKRIRGKIQHTKLVPLLAGDKVVEPGIVFNVVYPFEEGLGENKDSLSLFFKIGQKKWLMTGDLDQEGEKKILEHYPLLKVDYFKLGHHGSRTSSNTDFLHSINPSVVFISSGRNNRFGHPHPETLDTLKKLSIPYLNTQDSGTITWTYSILGNKKLTTFLKKEKE
ncbi:competence protein ComEC [Lactobacillus colini]|uniref:Competence protein ComEC n=1 Tax=Lactobacillus colini TaxID=1819254 RepID=A0ABS4MDP4_9LACO|nr:DNA internalization-related competence protein ComEC/Rec2 [Lactobacillus colini]MBP2057776.1 competence protein ComEC [Lactobacillus colini]